jgi:hypothetical protein
MGKAAAPASIQSQQTSDGRLCSATILCLSAAAEHPLSSRQIGPPPGFPRCPHSLSASSAV